LSRIEAKSCSDIYLFQHCIINILQLSFGYLANGDICGPTLKIPFIGSITTLPIIPLSIIIGLFINLRIMFHVCQHTNKTPTTRSYNKLSIIVTGGIRLRASEISEMRRCANGLLIQTTIPLIFVLPQTVAEGILFIDESFRAPRFFWIAINGATCIYLSINPLISLLSVQQFRQAARMLCRKYTSTTTVASAFK
uniref:G protein-coupled receptor n=1 Tax=Ascaris lumbricoides TaxID=6252 RepID=A0A0M3I3N9_ASCLU